MPPIELETPQRTAQTFLRVMINLQNSEFIPSSVILLDGYGAWSTEGCRKVTEGIRVVCHCDHMTGFGILLDVYAGKQEASAGVHEEVLGVISVMGVGLSLGGLFLTLLTLALFK